MEDGAVFYRRYLDGDESAFDELQSLYWNHLVFFIDGYVRDTAAAEDIAIEVFVYLLLHKHAYNPKYSLRSWLFTVARSKALNHLRRQKKIRTVNPEDAEAELADRRELAEEVIRTEQQQKLHAAIGRLREDMREAVYLIYFEQMTYEEAAKVMKINRKQIDNLLYRAKALLRRELEEEGVTV